MTRYIASFTCIFISTFGSAAYGQNSSQSGESGFVKWAKQSSIRLSTVTPGSSWEELKPLGKIIGNATVVALSEAPHLAAEPLEFRNRVLQYLVQEKGFYCDRNRIRHR